MLHYQNLIQLAEKQVEQNKKIIEKLEVLEKQNEYIGDKISIAEMRQCQANAQGTDASRMTSSYFKAENALWSSSAKASTLEMTYKSGDLSSIGYQGIFSDKDERRIEWMLIELYYKRFGAGFKGYKLNAEQWIDEPRVRSATRTRPPAPAPPAA